jgi:hypothetical protein
MSLFVQPNYFQVETDNPFDSRLQVATSTDRDNLAFKWQGMQVFVIADLVTYVLTTTGPDVWDVLGAGGGGAGHTIQNEGATLPTRTNLNFIGNAVDATDNPGANASDVTIDITVLDGGEEI